MGCFPNSPSGNIAVEPQLPRPQPQSKSKPQFQPKSQPKSQSQFKSQPQPKPNKQLYQPYPQAPPQYQPYPQAPPSIPQHQPQPSNQPTVPFMMYKDERPTVTANDKKLAEEIMSGFEVQKLMREKLDSVAHTSDQLQSIVSVILKAVVKLEQGQTPQEKHMVDSLLNNRDVNERAINELFYHGTVKEFKNKIKRDPKPETLSRIYHGIANLKKKFKFKSKQKHDNIQEKKTNDYDKLSAAQVDEVVKYEVIGEKILEFGTMLNFKLSSIEKDSNGIVRLLAQISSRYEKDIQGFKHDLSPQEFKKAAQISREACNHHDNGVVLLFIYFVKACKKLQKDGYSVASIEKKLGEAIKWISKEYPLGEGLDADQEHLERLLTKLQYEEQFTPQPFKFATSGDKPAQLENIILQHAYVAKHNREYFEELIKQTSSKYAIQTKVGLKLNPNNPNKNALMRIKKKMLFGKMQELDKKAKDTIQETIENQDKDYKEAIDRILKEKDEVTFNISDMVRGKCVFLEMESIILTVNQIKEFVRKDNKKRFMIIAIDTRYTYPRPMYDVTLKIVINKEIISELQLTIQTNAPAYNFAHKVYELARNKVFSKVKISHNYTEEFTGDFKMQVSKALQIAKRKSQQKDKDEEIGGKEADLKDKYGILAKQTATISKLLDLQSMETPTSYEEVLAKSISEQRGGLKGLTVSTDQKLQKLMVTLFRKQMGNQKMDMGREINQVMKSKQHPPLLKATLLYYFYQSFDISKQITPMIHFYPNYKQALEKMGKKQQYVKEDYMEMYLQQVFGIQKPFTNIRATARLFEKALPIQQITVSKKKQSVQFFVRKLIKGMVLEDNSPEKIDFISQLVLGFFMVRGEKQKIVKQFDDYYLFLMSLLNKQPRFVPKLASCPPKLLKAQQLLEEKKFKQAKAILDEIAVVFKENEEYEQELQCQLLLAECKANTDDFNVFREFYAKNVVKKAEALGIELRGVAVANSEFRIYQKLWGTKPNAEEKEYLRKTHLNKAMLESSKSEGVEWFNKMVKIESSDRIDDQCIQSNRTVKSVDLSSYEIYGKHMVHLERSRWPELSAFFCIQKNMRGKDCQHLSKADFKNLSILDLWDNNIGAEGCEHLSKADWKNLTSLNLEGNSIDAEACGHLSKANWKSLSYLRLNQNKLTDEGFQALAKADWPMLSTLKLNNCEISDAACGHISKANWKSLSVLDLVSNKIGNKGCEHLGRADWKSLSSLDLEENKVGHEGCEHLAKADFKSLVTFNLNNNEIGDKGCQHLAKSSWDKLFSLNLKNNNIGVRGCEHLSRADWQNLSKVNLIENKIGAEGCEHLISAVWKKLSSLEINDNKINKQEKPFLIDQWKQKRPKVHVAGL